MLLSSARGVLLGAGGALYWIIEKGVWNGMVDWELDLDA